eukprot:c5647_g1_i1.p1 GENE.c5647_g1_i1~~c5647_g1_i1.p1  ORF type:complete len:323 (+),score=90.26 c5647_g1_i1:51-971(+)
MKLAVLLLAFAAFVSATPLADQAALIPSGGVSDAPNLTHIARLYMNFGAEEGSLTQYNCTAWSRLWNEDGVRQTPGVPPSQGWVKLEQMCETVRSQFTMLFCDSSLNISVTSYNGEKRIAFQWTINGVLYSTGEQVEVPAITTLFMDSDGTIQTAWDFLDPTPFNPSLKTGYGAQANVSEIIRVYMNFGGFPNYPHAANCSQWATLFGDSGIRNTPGTPPVRGYSNLLQTCNDVRGQFETLLNYETFSVTVMSWNTELRAAFTWDIVGMSVSGSYIHKPVITALFMYPNGTIQNAWDFLDPHGIEP